LFGVEGMHVLDVTRDPDVGGGQGLVVLDVESDADLTGCPDCAVVAVGHGRHVQALHDAPSFGTPVRVRWRKRIRRCPEPSCRRGTWTEEHDFAPPRAKLTSRAVEWAVSLLRLDDTTVSAIARRLGVNWHTCWNAVKKHAKTSIDIKKRASGVKAIGVDEHIWRPSRISSADKAATGSPQRVSFTANSGEHLYRVVAIDAVGNESDASGEFTVIVDADKPKVGGVSAPAADPVSG
jgi:transposase